MDNWYDFDERDIISIDAGDFFNFKFKIKIHFSKNKTFNKKRVTKHLKAICKAYLISIFDLE